nr:MAG TPA: hypothetical protein [Caudoviricetes sp.]
MTISRTPAALFGGSSTGPSPARYCTCRSIRRVAGVESRSRSRRCKPVSSQSLVWHQAASRTAMRGHA